MTCDNDISIFRISKTEHVATSARNYRNLRLGALAASPASFASTQEIEAAFTDEEWIQSLTSPGRETFICAAIPPTGPTKWVGQVTLLGPLSTQPLSENHTPENAVPESDERWHMLSLFTFPEYRGQGLGVKLCQEVMRFIQDYRPQPETAQLDLIVKESNASAVRLYERLGFWHVRRCTLVEALIANGDGHLLPADRSAPKYTELGGLVMRIIISR
jgi:ribosomal protein S18 acetylase RimI-like enzyme